jgi:hypothetical protein
MNEEKSPDGQVVRVRRIMVAAQVELGQAGAAEVSYDRERDVVVATLFGTELARLGPREWDMNDDELKIMIVEAMIEELGDHRR